MPSACASSLLHLLAKACTHARRAHRLLTGLAWGEAIKYFSRYHGNDRAYTELAVAFNVVLVTAFAATNIAILWAMGVKQDWALRLIVVDPLMSVKIILGIWPNMVAQLFFCWRLHAFSGWWWYSAPVALLSVASMLILCIPTILGCLGIDFAPLAGRANDVSLTLKVADYGEVSFYLSFAVDVLVAAGLSYQLARRRSGFNLNTDGVLNRLLAMTLGKYVDLRLRFAVGWR
jgi:hypothetical protein